MSDTNMPVPSHRDIIELAGGPAAVGRKIGVDANTTKAWKRLNSIPAPHWMAIADAGVATLDQLALGAAASRRPDATPQSSAAA